MEKINQNYLSFLTKQNVFPLIIKPNLDDHKSDDEKQFSLINQLDPELSKPEKNTSLRSVGSIRKALI